MAESRDLSSQILDSSLRLAESDSWGKTSLQGVASDLGITLADIQRHYQSKDDLAEAWFDRADRAVLDLDAEGLAQLPVEERLHRIIFTWLDSLAEHRDITRQMLQYKLEPLHFHLQAQGITRISRTVQWFMESAKLEVCGLERVTVEIGLTSIYLATFRSWLIDNTENQSRSRNLLRRKLGMAGSIQTAILSIGVRSSLDPDGGPA